MEKRFLLIRLFALMAVLMCVIVTKAAEGYACYCSSDMSLTFYYDDQRDTRVDRTYDLNNGSIYPGWYSDETCNDITKVVFDPSFAAARPTSTCSWFNNMINLQTIDGMGQYLNTEEVTNMKQMFFSCNMSNLDVSNFNTANVVNMSGMFALCTYLKSLDLNNFNTEKVSNMMGMFVGCVELRSLDLRSFNTANVTDMSQMFMFDNNLTTIYVGNGWSTSSVNDSDAMFLSCDSLVGGQGTTYNSSHIDMAYAHIDGGPSDPGYLSEYKEAYACFTSSDMTLTFYCDANRDTRVGTTYDLNEGSRSPGWLSDETSYEITRVVFDPSFAAARPTSTHRWFYEMSNLKSVIDMEQYLNTEDVADMSEMFYNCSSLLWLNVSNFNTANVEDMRAMFIMCSVLKILDVSSFNTEKVSDMRGMFAGCVDLKSLDLSSFNTFSVTDMTQMFTFDNNLATIYVSNGWSTASVNNSDDMFLGCYSLVGGQGTVYDSSHIGKAYAHIDGGVSDPGYFTEQSAYLRGDVDGDGQVTITDASALLDYLLTGDGTGINLRSADCDLVGGVAIADMSALIDFLLNDEW